MAKQLARNVAMNGQSYKAGTSPPPDVAARITNPLAWGDDAPQHSDEKRQAAVTNARANADVAAAARAPSLDDRLRGLSASKVADLVADDDTVEFANAVLEWDMVNSKSGSARKAVASAVADVIG